MWCMAGPGDALHEGLLKVKRREFSGVQVFGFGSLGGRSVF